MQPDDTAPGATAEQAQSALLREALLARADAEAAEVRADAAREEAERARHEAERAREEAELGRSRLGVLAEAGRLMAQSIDWEATVQAVVRSAVPGVADWTSLTVLEPTGELRVVAVAHRERDRERLAWQLIARHPPDPNATSGAANVIRTGRPEVVEDLSSETIRAAAQDPEHLRLLENLNVRHLAIAPLKTPNGVLGTLTFVLGDSGRRFQDEDLQLITSLAARAALHIQNARLYTERSRIAEALQVGLRPKALPRIAGIEVAARFMPAGDHLVVGGDFYDVFPSDDDTWTLIIGDVSGKGAHAAAVTSLARHTLRAASMLVADPAANLALLNRALLADQARRFCTVLCVRARVEEGRVHGRFANGGHPPPLLARADGTIEEIKNAHGPLLGAFSDAAFETATFTLEPGDLLLMYTDGVTETRRRDVEAGERDLRATLAACAGLSSDEVVGAVERRAVELLAGRSRDDVALLAIKAPSAPVAEV
jgi:serine phosphatase RsbU (regulator of sigma subunit)